MHKERRLKSNNLSTKIDHPLADCTDLATTKQNIYIMKKKHLQCLGKCLNINDKGGIDEADKQTK